MRVRIVATIIVAIVAIILLTYRVQGQQMPTVLTTGFMVVLLVMLAVFIAQMCWEIIKAIRK
jgi:hypothetical protein